MLFNSIENPTTRPDTLQAFNKRNHQRRGSRREKENPRGILDTASVSARKGTKPHIWQMRMKGPSFATQFPSIAHMLVAREPRVEWRGTGPTVAGGKVAGSVAMVAVAAPWDLTPSQHSIWHLVVDRQSVSLPWLPAEVAQFNFLPLPSAIGFQSYVSFIFFIRLYLPALTLH